LDHILTTGKDLRTGWLLLMLSGPTSSGYGYDLRRELELRGLSLDPAVLYRNLREMEKRELIVSHWVHSDEGPRRRVYSITAAGSAELTRIAATIGAARDAHTAFLAAYAQRSRPRGDGEGGTDARDV
jgi:PadR family transcriptional regulator, regulatory protein PadR